MRIFFKILLALSGLRTLTFSRHSFQEKKNNKQLLVKNVVKNQLTSLKFLQEAFPNNTAKIKEKLPIFHNHKILTKSYRLPGNGTKMLGA